MYNVYFLCLIIGLAVLVLSIVGTGLSDLFQGSFDLDFDFDSEILSGLIPLSPLELCAFVVGFGGIGLTFVNKIGLHLIFALIGGFALSIATKHILKALKKVDSQTFTDDDLIGTRGIVTTTIFEKGVGSVSFNTKTGKISYAAKSAHGQINQGEQVTVVEIEGHTVIVTNDIESYFKSKE